MHPRIALRGLVATGMLWGLALGCEMGTLAGPTLEHDGGLTSDQGAATPPKDAQLERSGDASIYPGADRGASDPTDGAPAPDSGASVDLATGPALPEYLHTLDVPLAPLKNPDADPAWWSHELPRHVHGMIKTFEGLDGGTLSTFWAIYWNRIHFTARAAMLDEALGKNPELLLGHQISFNAMQDFQTDATAKASIPFTATGEISAWPVGGPMTVFAGHFVYRPFTRLSAAIGAEGNVTVAVANADRLSAGQYACIRPAVDDWSQAEHVLVEAVDAQQGTVTLSTRGYKSTARAWSAGALIATHVLGQGTNPQLWRWNQSTLAPRDAAGQRFHDAAAKFIAGWWCRDSQGADLAAKVCARIQFVVSDADGPVAYDGEDYDNDGVADEGMLGGRNHVADGWAVLAQRIHEELHARGRKGKLILSGAQTGRPMRYWAGGEVECAFTAFGAPAGYGDCDSQLDPFYGDGNFDWQIEMMANSLSAGVTDPLAGYPGPRVTFALSKASSKAYPIDPPADMRPTDSNRTFRFPFGAAALVGAAYMREHKFPATAGSTAWEYFDEWAVNLQRGPDYGKSYAAHDSAAIRASRGWFGKPKGGAQRVIADVSTYARSKSLLPAGDFTAKNAKVERVGDVIEVTPNDSYEGYSGAHAQTPTLDWTSTQPRLLVFRARLPAGAGSRKITLQVGSTPPHTQVIHDDAWRWYSTVFEAPPTGKYGVRFQVGREFSPLWLQEVLVFDGRPNVWRREFENALVIVNATSVRQQVPVEAGWRRIAGVIDPIFNDGQLINGAVALDPWDAIVLIRQ